MIKNTIGTGEGIPAGRDPYTCLYAWEVICEMIIPILMGRIVDYGVMAGNVEFIIRTGAVMIVVALLGLTAGILGGFCRKGRSGTGQESAQGNV